MLERVHAPAPAKEPPERPKRPQRRPVRVPAGQPRLVVGAADDVFEREADEIARRVVASLHGGTAGPGDEVLHRSLATTRIRRRAPVGAAGGEVDAETEEAIAAARSSGRSLGGDVRRTMERSIGADFGRVRIHEGPSSADLNRSMGAVAFTLGSDIFMRDRLDETSRSGQETLAHELVHVVQQGAAAQPQRLMRAPEGEAAGAPVDDEDLVLASGKIPGVIEAEGDAEEKGRESGKEDAVGARRTATSHSTIAGDGRASEMTIVPAARLNVATRRVEVGPDGRALDDVTGTIGAVTWSNPGTKTVNPFGSESFTPTVGNITFTAKKKKVDVSFDIDVVCEWGVNSGGHTDVPDASSGVVKLDTYSDIVADLTPKKVEKSWVATRDTYWSQAICARHEQFHSTDDRDWAQSTGKGIVTKYLTDHPITIGLLERRTDKVIEPKIKKRLAEAMTALETANTDFYRGGASSYYSYAGEERAFGDGKAPYEQLVAGVKAKGDALAEEDKKKKEEAKKKKEEKKKAKEAKAAAKSTKGAKGAKGATPDTTTTPPTDTTT